MMRRPYSLLNLIFIVLIILVLLYSAVFSSEKSKYPVQSTYTEITGNESISSGLSRSFSEIIRFNFREAYDLNPFGIRIFLFFLVQLFFRINFLIITKNRTPDPSLILLDIVLSAGVFVVAFWPFLVNAMRVIPKFF